jgi:hypothetical protein
MARARVDPAALQRFLDEWHTQADAARHFGVSEAAISQRAKQSRIATSKVVALERAAQVVDQKLTGIKAASQANGGGGSLRTLEAVHFGHMDVDVTIDDPGAYTSHFRFGIARH